MAERGGAAADGAGECQRRIITPRSGVDGGQRLAQTQLRGAQIGAPPQQFRWQAFAHRETGRRAEIVRLVGQRPGIAIEQQGDGVAGLDPLLAQLALRHPLAVQALFRLAHLQQRHRPGIELDLHQGLDLAQALQVRLAGGNALVEKGQLPVLPAGLGDQQQRGILQVLGAGAGLPAGDIPLGAQPPPEVDLPTQGDTDAVAAPHLVTAVDGATAAAADRAARLRPQRMVRQARLQPRLAQPQARGGQVGVHRQHLRHQPVEARIAEPLPPGIGGHRAGRMVGRQAQGLDRRIDLGVAPAVGGGHRDAVYLGNGCRTAGQPGGQDQGEGQG